MKKTLILSTIILAGAAFAQDKAPAAGGNRPLTPEMRDRMMGRMSEVLFKDCDANKDGKFDEKEAAAAKAALIKKYDANADGKIDETEFNKVREDAMAAGWKPRGTGGGKRGPAAPAAPQEK